MQKQGSRGAYRTGYLDSRCNLSVGAGMTTLCAALRYISLRLCRAVLVSVRCLKLFRFYSEKIFVIK